MEDKRLKQRLIGAIVLVSLGVIFIPMLLKGPDTLDTPILTTNIPPKPDRKTEVIPLKPLPPRPDKSPITSIPVEKETPAVKPEPAPPAAESKPAAKADKPANNLADLQGWVVQVGSFSRKSNALSLEGRLRKKGYSAYVEAYEAKSGTRYRVRVGPELSEGKSKATAASLKREMGIDGFVLHQK
jgi:DedD protein